MGPSLPRKSMPNRSLIEPLVFMFTGICEGGLWVSALRVMQLGAKPAMTQRLNLATNEPHPFLMSGFWTSIWLRQYTYKIPRYVNDCSKTQNS
jgi:hypothetical protein